MTRPDEQQLRNARSATERRAAAGDEVALLVLDQQRRIEAIELAMELLTPSAKQAFDGLSKISADYMDALEKLKNESERARAMDYELTEFRARSGHLN